MGAEEAGVRSSLLLGLWWFGVWKRGGLGVGLRSRSWWKLRVMGEKRVITVEGEWWTCFDYI